MKLTGRNHVHTKLNNKIVILQTLLRHGAMSRQDIAELTKLTPATITNLTAELIAEQLLVECGSVVPAKQRAGRRSVELDVQTNSMYVAGVHVRQDRWEAAIVNIKGEVISSRQWPLDGLNWTQLIPEIIQELKGFFHENKQYVVYAVGIGSFGLIRHVTGKVLQPNMGAVPELPLVEELERHLKLPVYIDNNVRAMAQAESLYGQGKIAENFLFVYIGWGIGAGLVLHHELYRSGATGAGELGHMTLFPDGEPCWCGNRGCLEMYASDAVLVKRLKLSGTDDLLKLARDGNTMARAALEEAGVGIGVALASYNNIFQIERVIIGGVLALEDLPLVHRVREEIQSRSFLARLHPVEVTVSSLGPNIGTIGAASLAVDMHFLTLKD
ncbi:ROK family transcriptional regulator [Paenibacillus radicis (ex Xue et al. 2023)]|uniref:ROK family protein n=1 Tax=Paenibacillus radicis (ex Xue et al. 2023) TaxID=2972489 RepID=A0ABT1YJ28_9BACL|nr:ROK family transcriptional regulator [Paenibacillus radicis (ex Xue et al. 2023)]MCR8633187.1 ROK family protein [Paenibacillus radicis (ex Xue et al. 2023)]